MRPLAGWRPGGRLSAAYTCGLAPLDLRLRRRSGDGVRGVVMIYSGGLLHRNYVDSVGALDHAIG